MRPQKYNPSLGLQGNIENALWENQYSNNHIYNNKADADAKLLSAEQTITDMDIAQIEAEQTITDLDLRLTVLEEG